MAATILGSGVSDATFSDFFVLLAFGFGAGFGFGVAFALVFLTVVDVAAPLLPGSSTPAICSLAVQC